MDRVYRLEFVFIAVMLGLAALLLIGVGKALWTTSNPLVLVAIAAESGIALVWLRLATTKHVSGPVHRKPNFFCTLTFLVLFLIFSILTFYRPMQIAFWNNTDDGEMLYLTNTKQFSEIAYQSDSAEARPFEMFGVELARLFTPDSINGYLWLVFMLRCASALLVYGIVQQLTQSRYVALISSLLFMVNPSEPWRFIAIVMMDYYLSLFLFLLAVWLYLSSYRRAQRWQLLAGCLALIVSLLIRESALLLALLVPLLLILQPRHKGRPLWLLAWGGTLALMAARFALFLVSNADSYQSHQTQRLTSLAQIADNFQMQILPIFGYVRDLDSLLIFWQTGLVAAVVAASILLLHGRLAADRNSRPHRKRLIVGLLVSGVSLFLAIAPYFSFTQPARTQFFAAPIQAIACALIIELAASGLLQKWRLIWRVGMVGFMVASAVASSMSYQRAQSGTSFEKIVCIFDEVHRTAPIILPDSLVLLVLHEDRSPFGGRNYQLMVLSRLALGVDTYQAGITDVYGRQTTFDASGVTLPPDPHDPPGRVEHYSYSQVIAFDVAPDGQTSLLDSFPQELLPEGLSADGYAPRSRIQPGAATRLRFLHYSDWMTRGSYC